jgi:hypothetical protein
MKRLLLLAVIAGCGAEVPTETAAVPEARCVECPLGQCCELVENKVNGKRAGQVCWWDCLEDYPNPDSLNICRSVCYDFDRNEESAAYVREGGPACVFLAEGWCKCRAYHVDNPDCCGVPWPHPEHGDKWVCEEWSG